MAITKSARTKIFTLVQEIKKLLVLEVGSQLEQFYGIRLNGTILLAEELPLTEPDVLHTARLLRQRLDYIKSNIPSEKNKEVEAIKQLLNEQAFSILNRFSTLRMAEERGIIKETIRKEYNSEGFQIFDSITGQGAVAEQYIRYKWYLHSIFDELSIDLPSVFDRFSPYALIFPSEKAMRSLLTIINNEAVTMHREDTKKLMNLWQEDETIGWIYQYYNSREEISEMRDASDAPRNSRELAVRNQFFTPRYVVQFLTDNSLGRIWYEMTKGKTELIHKCQYLIRRPKELFLEKANNRPENADEETDYIEHRQIKDPREILMLDPACGSMHFGLYSFDLFEQIYIEAWDNHPELMLDLRNSITRKQYANQIPEFIIRYNVHGVDIDPRALQIAALSLWLRAQMSFEILNLEPGERPQITKSNLVLAEAMPGNVELLSALVKPLDAPLRKLVTTIWELMRMAGETGLLLRIEEEIDKNINEIAADLSKDAIDAQLELGADSLKMKAAEKAAFYSTKKYRDSFLENAASEVFRILKELSENATNGDAYQKLLFADDTARGFAFIELCRKKYDVVLMNPPFGSASLNSEKYIDTNYPKGKNDLAAVFVERMHEMLNRDGFIGAISTRTIFFLGSYKAWRQQFIIDNTHLKYFTDLGNNVLDAMVETAAYIISKKQNRNTIFIRATKSDEKDLSIIESLKKGSNIYNQDTSRYKDISNQPLCYWVDRKTLKLFIDNNIFGRNGNKAFNGSTTSDNPRFIRLFWEFHPSKNQIKWINALISDESLRFFNNLISYINWENDGFELNNLFGPNGKLLSTIRNPDYNFKLGISWALRTAMFQPHIVTKQVLATASRNMAQLKDQNDTLYTCALWNSKYFDYILKLSMEADSGNPKFINGVVNLSPFPELSVELKEKLACETLLNHSLIENIFNKIETSLYFKLPVINNQTSLKSTFKNYQFDLQNNKRYHLSSLDSINDMVYDYFNISIDEQFDINEIVFKSRAREEGAIFDKSDREFVEGVFSWLIGCVFGRWDVRFALHTDWLPVKYDIFSSLPACSPGSLINTDYLPASDNNIVSEAWLSARKTIENKEVKVEKPSITKKDYPIPVLWDGVGVVDKNHPNDIFQYIRSVIKEIWQTKAGEIEDELTELLGGSDLVEWLNSPNRFFNSHLNQYSQNKRTAPIYWPISTASGGYTVWLYYPKLTDQTLVAVINNYLQPKIDEVIKQKKPLELNSILDNKGLKELKELNDFEHELEEMKKELLRITALPYKPNHDDGVLITAAPLHKLFRHTKWRKETEDCWKELETGEYDWAHLAYSIWPNRVAKKCKRDLSMAIAHGLEDICDVKPKEKKMKAAKSPLKVKDFKQLRIDE